VPVAERGWDVDVRVQYEPGRLTAPPRAEAPEYRSILDQRQGSLLDTAPEDGGALRDALALHLAFGTELTLRTAGRSVQLVAPAPGSP